MLRQPELGAVVLGKPAFGALTLGGDDGAPSPPSPVFSFNLLNAANGTDSSTFIRAAGNKTLNQAIRSVTKGILLLWLTSIYYKQSDLVSKSISEHKKIINALKKKDSDTADKEVRKHILNVYDRSLSQVFFDSNGDWILDYDAIKREGQLLIDAGELAYGFNT